MTQRVVNEVRGEAFSETRAARCRRRAEFCVQSEFPVSRFRLAGGEGLPRDCSQGEGLLRVQACLASCQREQRFDELFLLGAACKHSFMRSAE